MKEEEKSLDGGQNMRGDFSKALQLKSSSHDLAPDKYCSH